jgi:molecular chaperone DnaK
MVGGMSRFPAVGRALRERLGVDPMRHEPDLAVAKGAALYASALRVRSAGPVRPAPGSSSAAGSAPGPAAASAPAAPVVQRMAAARVAGVVPRAFGLIGVDGSDPIALTDPMSARRLVLHLLLANTQLPADTGPYTVLTAIDNRRMVEIEVWEQAGPELAEDLAANRRVGKGMLRNLPPRLPARSPIEVTFFMSETGRLTVHAKELQSGSDVRFDLQIGDFDSSGIRQARQTVGDYEVDG